MVGAIILWSHALAALAFGALAASGWRSRRDLPRAASLAAFALTALWALAMAGIGGSDVATRLAESLRNVAWFALVLAMLRATGVRLGIGLDAVFAVACLICVATGGIALVETAIRAPELQATRLALRMLTAVTGLVVIDRVAAQPTLRGDARLLLAVVALLWSADLILYAITWFVGAPVPALLAARGVAFALAPALLALTLDRPGATALRLSRSFAFHTIAVAGIVTYLAAMGVATGWFATLAGGQARLVQTAFVAGGGAFLCTIVASPWLRAWTRVKVAKHLFAHRYDYRAVWLRFTATLGRSDAVPAPIEQRVAEALAGLIDAPGGLVLALEGADLTPLGGWRWTAAAGPLAGASLVELASDRILILDDLRARPDALPDWLAAAAAAWVVVPLIHRECLTGAVVLARPPVAPPLDWEDFDLLRVAGRQAASHLAEGRAAAALAEAQRFDEFNRRFAFILHDVKNLVSQLTLVARNAERHADNPAFRADMIATLRDSCGRMSALLQKLSPQAAVPAAPPSPTSLGPVVARTAARFAARHPVGVTGDAVALVDPARLDQLLGQLIQNAIEASPADAPVQVEIAHTGAAASVTITDRGAGMSAAFVRDDLFRPFASSKPGGFGLGAYEARQLALAMGGTVSVDSAVGHGTRFAVRLPLAPALGVAA